MRWDILLSAVTTIVTLVMGLGDAPDDKAGVAATLRKQAARLLDKAAEIDPAQAEDQRILNSRIAKPE